MQKVDWPDSRAWCAMACLTLLFVCANCSVVDQVAGGGPEEGSPAAYPPDVHILSGEWAASDGSYRVVARAAHVTGIKQVAAYMYEECPGYSACDADRSKEVEKIQLTRSEHGRWVGEMSFERKHVRLEIWAKSNNDQKGNKGTKVERDEPDNQIHVVTSPEDLEAMCDEHCPTLNGKLFAVAVPGLEDFEGLEELETITGSVTIANNAELESLRGLESLQRIEEGWVRGRVGGKRKVSGTLGITSNPALESVEGLDALERVEDLTVRDNRSLRSLSALQSATVSRDLAIHDNPKLTRLPDLEFERTEDVEHTRKGVSVRNNSQLEDISGLDGLETTRSVAVVGNGSLSSLEGLEDLQAVDSLYVIENDTLASLDALENLTRVVSKLDIEDNPELDPCAIDSLLDRLAMEPERKTVPDSVEDC